LSVLTLFIGQLEELCPPLIPKNLFSLTWPGLASEIDQLNIKHK